MDEIKNNKKKERHTKESFIAAAEKLHGVGRYTYENIEYVNNKTPVEITCPEHGSFMQRPDNHLHGAGCPVCRYEVSQKRSLQ